MKVTNRKRSGQSLVELAAGLIVFVPIILVLIDCGVLMIGVSVNEAACHDAARAASSGPPAGASGGTIQAVAAGAAPYQRAVSVVKSVYTVGGLISISQNLSVKEALVDPVPQKPTGGPVIGKVTVETTAEISPPFLIRVFAEKGAYKFKSTQQYPYTYVMPSS